ncbi:glycosyltransferase family 4 protein [Carnimonas bestiolae]|uniref:glycosyltransferase family 4 protein n=1 Tax=Carnimonas bestiolae TaxID=3402172 RepID=UPI003EDCA517
MHIADVTMFYAPSSGGVRTYLDAKRQRLKQLEGVRHTLVVPLTEGTASSSSDDVIRVPSAPLPFSNGYRFPLRRGPWIERLVNLQPSIIEAADPYVAGWACLEAGRKLDIPVIGFYHSDLPEMIGSRFGNFARRKLQGYVNNLYNRFERVLAPSQVMADTLSDMGVRNVHVQPLGVDSSLYCPSKRDPRIREALELAPDTRLLIFAGRGSHEKNLPVLLDTMRHLGSGYHLLMIGSNMPSQVPDNVSVINHFVPQQELARYFASADALLHAGTNETFGLIVLEAMASGLPVVVARAGALQENVTERFGRLSRPHDAVDMAAAVADLFAHDAAELGRQARLEVERHHDWSAVVDSVMHQYRDALGISEAPPLQEAFNS